MFYVPTLLIRSSHISVSSLFSLDFCSTVLSSVETFISAFLSMTLSFDISAAFDLWICSNAWLALWKIAIWCRMMYKTSTRLVRSKPWNISTYNLYLLVELSFGVGFKELKTLFGLFELIWNFFDLFFQQVLIPLKLTNDILCSFIFPNIQ